eukprot:12122002-Alexandrium_andersonii.AAC.1
MTSKYLGKTDPPSFSGKANDFEEWSARFHLVHAGGKSPPRHCAGERATSSAPSATSRVRT